MTLIVVARVFRRGVFLTIGKQTLAPKEAGYKFATAVERKSRHRGGMHSPAVDGGIANCDSPGLKFFEQLHHTW
jgi:hypothetical protein